ncbi:hypothetical protein [uncultured Desulfovibrio sp.]|uniref:hypothetical protein n=1 Tax=uncultured Desulfovibrio sp. TaxID=167968 RepID=UPI0026098F66|nr:hypothetical protein [uncultured Desulfovibrio sp.]
MMFTGETGSWRAGCGTVPHAAYPHHTASCAGLKRATTGKKMLSLPATLAASPEKVKRLLLFSHKKIFFIYLSWHCLFHPAAVVCPFFGPYRPLCEKSIDPGRKTLASKMTPA